MKQTVMIVVGSIMAVVNATAGTGREVQDFNADWEFVQADSAQPLQIPEKFLVPRADWKAVSASSEEDERHTGAAHHMWDGNDATFWHSAWKNNKPDFPHEVVIDLGASYAMEGVVLTHRESASYCQIGRIEISIAKDRSTWGKPILTGNLPKDQDKVMLSFPRMVEGRYIKLRALAPVENGSPFATIAELDLIRKSDTGSAWEDQFMIQHVAESAAEDSGLPNLESELQQLAEKSWAAVRLPHGVIEDKVGNTPQWQGICFYRKGFVIDPANKGRSVALKFEGAMQLADVWINGEHVARHAGGFTPFSVDLTTHLRFDRKNELVVRLDNQDNPEIPPGKPVASLDFNYFSGLYRGVTLEVTDPVRITDPIAANKMAGGGVFVTYKDVSDKRATVIVQTHVQNHGETQQKIEIRQLLLNSKGRSVGTFQSKPITLAAQADHTTEQTTTVKNPKLWSPDAPNLYTLRTEVVCEGKVLDATTTRIGVRWIEFSREEGFKINGTPLRIVGTNRHQDYPWIGHAASQDITYRDLWKIRNAGFNCVRLGHYPQDPSVYDACDELGLLAIDPIPGWQFFNKSSVFIDRTYRDIRDMIRRDRNHPCIIMWEVILNESWPPNEWKDKAHQIAHEEYPGPQCFTAGDMYGYQGWDILYNDWDESHTRPNDSDKSGFIREYGDYEFGGGNSTSRRMRGAGDQDLLVAAWNVVWSHNKHRSQYPWTVGDANWAMFDHNRGCATTLSSCGNSDCTRLPKFGFWFFQSQRDPQTKYPLVESGPMAKIAHYWTPQTEPQKVVVFSNCDEIELFINGRLVTKQKPDSGPDTPYHPENIRHTGGNAFDGGNCNQLAHPPFTFQNIEWEKGELKAVGYLTGKRVTEDIVRTPEAPVNIHIQPDVEGKTLEGYGMAFIHARLVDAHGTTALLDNTTPISFQIEGPAELLSPATVTAEAGIGTVLIRATADAGNITISAKTESGLTGQTVISF